MSARSFSHAEMPFGFAFRLYDAFSAAVQRKCTCLVDRSFAGSGGLPRLLPTAEAFHDAPVFPQLGADGLQEPLDLLGLLLGPKVHAGVEVNPDASMGALKQSKGFFQVVVHRSSFMADIMPTQKRVDKPLPLLYCVYTLNKEVDMNYAETIQKLAPKYDPRHIEGYMRLQYSTLDHLDKATFRREVRIACGCVDEGGVQMAERNAKSYGL